MSEIPPGFLIKALTFFPNKSDGIRIYQEVLRSYHRNLRARNEVPQVRNSFQERGDRIAWRFEGAQAEATARPRDFPTIVQIQLRSLTRSFEKVAEARRQKEEQEALRRASTSFQEREDRITGQSEEAQAVAVLEARLKSLEHRLEFFARKLVLEAHLRQTQYELRVLILELAIEEQKTVRQIEEQISKPTTLTTLAQLQLQALTQEFEALREGKYQHIALQQSKKKQAPE